MFFRDVLIEGAQAEANIIKHLYTKVTPEMLGYRPTPGQRSLQELIEFLPVNAGPYAKAAVTEDWSKAGDEAKLVKEAAAKDFPGTIDREFGKFADLLRSIPDADFENKIVKLPSGDSAKLGFALANFIGKFFTAYRMQLFLYLKSAGRTELNTSNCWRGRDMEVKPK